MASWGETLLDVESATNPIGFLETRIAELLKTIHEYVNRNVISYYSAWLTKPTSMNLEITDSDKNAFMQAVYKMDKSKGLDLILHTPGGDIAATESIVDYLNTIFSGDVRAVVPQLSMSAGTMIALACKSIVMGKQSNLGPIDPQFRGISCQEALDEFEQAKREVSLNPVLLGLWQTMIAKYTPTFLVTCKNAVDLSESLATQWINKNTNIKTENHDEILRTFVRHNESKTHSRHISVQKCKEVGLNVIELGKDPFLQDLILSLHHCFMILFDKTAVVKAVQNQLGARYYRMDKV